jgi:hypothetical protein
VQRGALADQYVDGIDLICGEAGSGDADGILAGLELQDVEEPVAVCGDRLFCIGALVADGDRGAGCGCAGRVENRAGDGAGGGGLRVSAGGKHQGS